MKKIYMFLDVDGVFNNLNNWKKKYFKYGFSSGTYSIDEKNIRKFAKLYRQLGKKYEMHCVLSSTWRLSKDGRAVILNRLRDNGIKLEGITEPEHQERGKQILKYLSNINNEYDLAIAIDDDNFDINPFLNEKFYLVNTDCNTGYTKKDSLKIKRIIRRMKKLWKTKEQGF